MSYAPVSVMPMAWCITSWRGRTRGRRPAVGVEWTWLEHRGVVLPRACGLTSSDQRFARRRRCRSSAAPELPAVQAMAIRRGHARPAAFITVVGVEPSMLPRNSLFCPTLPSRIPRQDALIVDADATGGDSCRLLRSGARRRVDLSIRRPPGEGLVGRCDLRAIVHIPGD